MYKYIATGNYIAEQILNNRACYIDDAWITLGQLMPLVYISYGRGLSIGVNLLEGDKVLAKPKGAIPIALYQHYSKFVDSRNLVLFLSAFQNNVTHLNKTKNVTSFITSQEKKIIDLVIEDYSRFNAFYLFEVVTKHGTPWQKTIDKEGLDAVIPDELTKEYYTALLKKF